jgi:DNA polymerase III gamma/tau subunit
VKLRLPQELCPPSVRTALLSVYETGRVPHALVFEGDAQQTLALAKWLAQVAVCLAPEERPCGHCAGCRKALAGSHPDIMRLGGGEAGRSFHKEEISELRRNAYIRPNEAGGRVFILENAQNLSPQAQNALLKVLEEPPTNVQFLLTCDRATSLLDTVRSRSQIYTLSATEQPQDDGLVAQIALAVCRPKESELLYLTAPLTKDRVRLHTVLEKLMLLFRDALVLRSGGTAVSGETETAEKLAQQFTRAQLYRFVQTAWEMLGDTERNANTALLVTTLCARLRSAAEH